MTVLEDNQINGLPKDWCPAEAAEPVALARCLEKYIERHGEKNQSFDALQALVKLTIKRMEQGKSSAKFTALNILTEASISTPDGKGAGTRLSPIWNKLTDSILPIRQKGIQDFARNQGLDFYPWPEKEKTEGGHPSQYYLKGCPLPENDISTAEPVDSGQIAYIRELTPEPSWWAKPLLKNGYRLEGWRRWLFMAYGVGTILLGAIVVIHMWSALWLTPAWSTKDLSISIFTSAFFVFSLWQALSPFFRLLEWRIVMAPTWLVALSEFNVQMEIVRDVRIAANSPGTIRLVRYASTCPQCKAKIEVEDGRKEFLNRLVGKCRENPREHVYSFDRFTCRGRNLR